jgi:hypothetical protein
LILVAAGVGLVVFAVMFTRPGDVDNKRLDARLSELRAAIPEPGPPEDAVLLSLQEYKGDLVSDGPAIAWTYSFSGTDDEFVEHYQSTLTAAGWTYRSPHGFAGQLALFDRSINGDTQSITVDSGPSSGTYVVTAYG